MSGPAEANHWLPLPGHCLCLRTSATGSTGTARIHTGGFPCDMDPSLVLQSMSVERSSRARGRGGGGRAMARGSPETAPWRLVAGRSLSGPCQRWGPGATCRDGHWAVACRCFSGNVAAGHGHGHTILLSRLVVGRNGVSDPSNERGSWGLFVRGERRFGAAI